jgi:hypothetical protein
MKNTLEYEWTSNDLVFHGRRFRRKHTFLCDKDFQTWRMDECQSPHSYRPLSWSRLKWLQNRIPRSKGIDIVLNWRRTCI